MRIRQVKPSFFKDALLADLSPAVRLTYIGLWMLADDGGYYRWDAAEAGLELYGYESRTKRERAVTDHLEALVAVHRIVRFPDLECDHIHIPRLVDHQRFGGPTKRVTTYQVEHARCSPRVSAGTRDSPPGTVRYGIGTERNGDGTVDAREREPETEFQRLVGRPAALGGTVQ